MTNLRQTPSSIEAEAASWVAQLDSGLRTDADRIALREWMARSPKHAAELRNLAQLWGNIDLTLQLNIDQHNDAASLGSFLSAWFSVRPRQIYSLMASFATIVGCVLFVVVLINSGHFTEDFRQTYSVSTGEQREVKLSDGSKVHINTDSLVEVHYTRKLRVLRLLKGEAHFDVAHEPNRPFQVYAGPSLLTAIGTAFSVRLDSKDVSVIVTEGRVQLSDVKMPTQFSDGINFAPVVVAQRSVITAGEGAEVDGVSREVNIIQNTSMDRRLAWRNGLVMFQNDSLQHVIDEVTRYTSMSLVIADASIRDKRFSGTFKTGEVVALLGALESSFGIDVEFTDDNTVYLTRQPASSNGK